MRWHSLPGPAHCRGMCLRLPSSPIARCPRGSLRHRARQMASALVIDLRMQTEVLQQRDLALLTIAATPIWLFELQHKRSAAGASDVLDLGLHHVSSLNFTLKPIP